MKSPLIAIDILSIYKNKLGDQVPMPQRLAKCTPDMYRAIMNIAKDLSDMGGKLILSDLFRTYDMQSQAHLDYTSGKKSAYSPPPGGSFHEAGRAFDLDLASIKISLKDFWTIAAKYGVVPIISQPDPGQKEAWHFDCRGSHQIIYDYYKSGKGNNFSAYTAAAASAILSVGLNVDAFGSNQKEAAIQSCLIRLGKDIGNIDGQIGRKTQKGIEEAGLTFNPDKIAEILMECENLIQQKFPDEFEAPVI